MVGKLVRMVLVTALMTAAIGAVPALAGSRDVIRQGSCSGRSDWKLKLSPENGRIEVQFEVDSNRVGQTWRVRLRHDGVLFFNALRTTQGPSGSFEVRRVVANHAGTDAFRARAVNVNSGETCVGTASF
jgi:hypothetical protein